MRDNPGTGVLVDELILRDDNKVNGSIGLVNIRYRTSGKFEFNKFNLMSGIVVF